MSSSVTGVRKAIYLSATAFLIVLLSGCQEKEKYTIKFAKGAESEKKFRFSGTLQAVSSDTTLPKALDVRYDMLLHRVPVNKYDDGSARYKLQVDSLNYHSEQRTVEECRHIERYMADQFLEFKMNERGEINDFTAPAKLPELENAGLDLRRLIMKLQPVLPAFEIHEGSTWEKEHALPGKMNADGSEGKPGFVYKWFRVQKIYEKDGKRYAEVLMNLKYRLQNEAGEEPAVQTSDFILGSGSVVFDILEGDLHQVNLEINGKVNVISSNDSLPPIQMRQTLRMRQES